MASQEPGDVIKGQYRIEQRLNEIDDRLQRSNVFAAVDNTSVVATILEHIDARFNELEQKQAVILEACGGNQQASMMSEDVQNGQRDSELRMKIIVTNQVKLQSLVERQYASLLEKLDAQHVSHKHSHTHLASIISQLDGMKKEAGKTAIDSPTQDEVAAIVQPAGPNKSGIEIAKVEEEQATEEHATGPLSTSQKIRVFVKSGKFEGASAIIILFNTFLMAFHLQLKGLSVAHDMGWRGDDGGLSSMGGFFSVTEFILNVWYLLELLLRIYALGWDFPKNLINWSDAAIVVGSCIDSILPVLLGNENKLGSGVAVLRVVRIFRVARLAKFLRVAENLSEMRVLLRTLSMSVRAIGWSGLLLGFIIGSAAIFMAHISIAFVDDQSIDLNKREWLWKMFGTTTRSMYTMFEGTFTGAWRVSARPTIEDIHPAYAIFWIIYVIAVNFMVMRVVGALFVKQTFAVADLDKERVAMEKMKQREKFAAYLRSIFAAADSSGDGALTKDEFDAMLADPEIVAHFEQLDLDIDEVVALFDVLSADDGEADYEEFLKGALKMKSSVRTIDTVQILHALLRTERNVRECLQVLAPNKIK